MKEEKKRMARPRKREPPQSGEAWDELHASQCASMEASALYSALIADLEASGRLNSATRSLARDAAAQEDIIVAAMEDIKKRGAVEAIEQGAQKLRVENRYLRAKLRAEQRKQEILEALGLLPGKRGPGRPAREEKAEQEEAESDIDAQWRAFDHAAD